MIDECPDVNDAWEISVVTHNTVLEDGGYEKHVLPGLVKRLKKVFIGKLIDVPGLHIGNQRWHIKYDSSLELIPERDGSVSPVRVIREQLLVGGDKPAPAVPKDADDGPLV